MRMKLKVTNAKKLVLIKLKEKKRNLGTLECRKTFRNYYKPKRKRVKSENLLNQSYYSSYYSK